MSKKKGFRLCFAFTLGCLVICIIGGIITAVYLKYSSIREMTPSIYPKWDCLKPPRDDYIGTWYAGSPERSDTLIIREDGFYKQIIYIVADVNYESEWQSWWLEYTPDGNFLHLEGMNLCAAFFDLEDCEHTGGNNFYWGNFCVDNPSGEGIPANGEGILIAMRSPGLSKPPRGLFLRPMYLQEFPWGYKLTEP